ncbi:MAG: carbon-nitrogen hydrolase family protein [Archaeoglobaceae archaeon]
MRVAAVQCRIGDYSSAERVALSAIERGAEFLLFPEYFSYGSFELSELERTVDFLRRISREYDVVTIGNAVVGDAGLRNRAFIFDGGEVVGYQDKIHPTRTEREFGIVPGDRLSVFEVRGAKIAVLVCADILYPELCRVAGIKGAELAFNPVVSFKYSQLPGGRYRYCLYFTRSFDNGYAVVKAGGFGYTFTGQRAAGRSLIATFDGILAKASSEEAEEALVVEIDLERIREFRELNYSLFDRNVRAYEDLLKD